MHERKLIINCKVCHERLRIPADQHIIFTCPFCKTRYNYNNNDPSITIDNTAQQVTSNMNKKWNIKKMLLFIMILSSTIPLLWLLGLLPRTINLPDRNTDITTTIDEVVTHIPLLNPNNEVPANNTTDTLFEYLISELGKEAKEKILDQLIDEINKLLAKKDWKEANSVYERMNVKLSEIGDKDQDFRRRAEIKLNSLRAQLKLIRLDIDRSENSKPIYCPCKYKFPV